MCRLGVLRVRYLQQLTSDHFSQVVVVVNCECLPSSLTIIKAESKVTACQWCNTPGETPSLYTRSIPPFIRLGMQNLITLVQLASGKKKTEDHRNTVCHLFNKSETQRQPDLVKSNGRANTENQCF